MFDNIINRKVLFLVFLGLIVGFIFCEKFPLKVLAILSSSFLTANILAIIFFKNTSKKINLKKFLIITAIFFAAVIMLLTRYYFYTQYPANHYSNFVPIDSKAKSIVLGSVVSSIEETIPPRGPVQIKFLLEAKHLVTDSKKHKVSGLIEVYSVYVPEDIFRTYKVILRGKLSVVPEYKTNLLRKKIKYRLYVRKPKDIKIFPMKNPISVLDSFRTKLKNYAYVYVITPFNYLLTATLLDDRRSLNDTDLFDSFRLTGTVHLLAISGLHFVIIMFLLSGLLKLLFFPRKMRYLLTMLIVLVYTIFLDARPSILRSTVFMEIFLIAKFFEREYDGWNLLGLAGIFLLMLSPYNILDVGFQFSFLCIAGLFISKDWPKNLTKKLNKYSIFKMMSKNKIYNWTIEILAVSFGVWLLVEPLSIYYFNIFTPVSIIANLIAAPASFVTIVSGIGFFACAIFFPQIVQPAGFVFALLCKFVLAVLNVFLHVPFAYFCLPSPSFLVVLLYYLTIVLLVLKVKFT